MAARDDAGQTDDVLEFGRLLVGQARHRGLTEAFWDGWRTMKVDVSSEIVIQRPRNEVATYSSNPDNVPTWYVNIKTVEWKTRPPVQIGSQIAFVAHFLGRRMAYTYEVVELVPSERLVMRTAQGPFPMETTYTWETTADGGTRMTLRNRGTPTGFSKLVAPLMGRAVRNANLKDLAALKKLLETGGAASPGTP